MPTARWVTRASRARSARARRRRTAERRDSPASRKCWRRCARAPSTRRFCRWRTRWWAPSPRRWSRLADAVASGMGFWWRSGCSPACRCGSRSRSGRERRCARSSAPGRAPQALRQCTHRLAQMGIERVVCYDTAGAAEIVAADASTDAAVCCTARGGALRPGSAGRGSSPTRRDGRALACTCGWPIQRARWSRWRSCAPLR